MTPKYKIGDIVRLYPWSDIESHDRIPKIYWEDIAEKDLKIFHVHREVEDKIYYNFKAVMFAWNEKFLKPTNIDFLSDKDFEL